MPKNQKRKTPTHSNDDTLSRQSKQQRTEEKVIEDFADITSQNQQSVTREVSRQMKKEELCPVAQLPDGAHLFMAFFPLAKKKRKNTRNIFDLLGEPLNYKGADLQLNITSYLWRNHSEVFKYFSQQKHRGAFDTIINGLVTYIDKMQTNKFDKLTNTLVIWAFQHMYQIPVECENKSKAFHVPMSFPYSTPPITLHFEDASSVSEEMEEEKASDILKLSKSRQIKK
ncbi:MAG: hypothetical protein ACE365_02810 [Gammaproteobacteria bacterium]